MNPYYYEPFEVSLLKKQLAQLTCKCNVCEKHLDAQCVQTESYTDKKKLNDKVVQAEYILSVEPTEKELCKSDDTTYNTNVDILCNNITCPGCYIACKLLKLRETKIFKDEATETNPEVTCCDKSVGKCVKFADSATSTSSIIQPALKTSNTSFSGKMIDKVLNGIMKKRSNEQVIFSDHNITPNQEIQALHGNCYCLQHFIDSIRPPFDYL